MKLLSYGVKKFLVIFSSVFLILFSWLMLSIYTDLGGTSMLWLIGLFVLACLGKACLRIYKKRPALMLLVLKLSLSAIFAVLVGYFWYSAWRWETKVVGDEDFWYRLPTTARLEILVTYTKALFKTMTVYCVGSFTLRCFKTSNK